MEKSKQDIPKDPIALLEVAPRSDFDEAIATSATGSDVVTLGLKVVVPCATVGIATAIEQIKVLVQSRTQKWDVWLEQEIAKILCRSLSGGEVVNILVSGGFAAVKSAGGPHSASWNGYWLRTLVVDTKMKSPSVVPKLDTLFSIQDPVNLQEDVLHGMASGVFRKLTTFSNRFDEAKFREAKHKPIGGHVDSILFDADVVWKKGLLGSKALAELCFLRLALEMPEISTYVPDLKGLHMESDGMWFAMKNVLHGFQQPAVMDLKIGTRTHPPDACPARAAKREKMAAETTSSTLGFRVVGANLLNPGGEFITVGYKHNDSINSEEGVRDLLSSFFCTKTLLSATIKSVCDIACWMQLQSKFALYSSSLLFAYDTQTMKAPVVQLIDFANFKFIRSKEEDLTGFQFGLRTLHHMLNQTIPVCTT